MSLLSEILQKTHFEQWSGEELASFNPADGKELGRVRLAEEEDYDDVMWEAAKTFERWRMEPAPKRGEIVREIGEELRAAKDELGSLVTLEMGKILAEGRGEVQEMIDIATFAAGLSRQLYGLSMHSERPGHRMYEQWHPLGVVGIISAFNFPVAVWSWNALLAMVCGDTVVWKPSLKTPLTAIAVQKIADRVLEGHGWKGVLNLVIGKDDVVGERLINDPRVPLISATGSTRMGRHVAQVVAKRLGRTLLELGGNNGLIVMDDAHGAGVLGKTGKGTLEAEGVSRQRVVQCITLSKAFGVYGGAVLGTRDLRKAILNRSRLFIGCTPMPLPLANAARAAVKTLKNDQQLRLRLFQNTSYVKSTLREADFELPQTPGPIVPLHLSGERKNAALKRRLLAAGIYPPFLKYPGGPATAYFRFVISSEHSRAQLDNMVEVLTRHRG